MVCCLSNSFLFFNGTATTEIYTLSYTTLFRSVEEVREYLREPRPVGREHDRPTLQRHGKLVPSRVDQRPARADRKSTRLNSSHRTTSYAVFCLKKKTKKQLE